MTDNEIIKALECCKDDGFDGMPCKDCPYAECDSKRGCVSELCEDALALINRQKAEIERLTAMVEAAEDYLRPLAFKNAFDAQILKAKSEAVKEFAETVKKNHLMLFNNIYSHKEFVDAIDRLVKETVGDKE